MSNCELETKLALLSNPLWSNQDIMDYIGCSINKATDIRQKAINNANGLSSIYPKKVKRDSVLKVLGLSVIAEIHLIKEILGNKEEKINES